MLSILFSSGRFALDALKTAWLHVKVFALAHKLWAAVIAIVIIGGGWWTYSAVASTSSTTRYVLADAETGTIVSTVSASGQVAATNEVDISSKVSGTITSVDVVPGQKVSEGKTLMTIDDTDALQTLEQAENTLQTDKLNYQKSAAEAPIDYQNDVNALSGDYVSMWDDLTNTYLDLPNLVSAAEDALYGYDFDPKKFTWNMSVLMSNFTGGSETTDLNSLKTKAMTAYTSANSGYEAALTSYKAASASESHSALDALLAQTIAMQGQVVASLQADLDFLDAVSDDATNDNISLPSSFSAVQTNARSELSTATSDLDKLQSDQQTLATAAQTVTLDQVGDASGDNPISLQTSANSIAAEEQNIANEKADLADYTITSPFSGTISAVNVEQGDNAGSGAAVATIISDSQVVEMSLNEVDAAKLALGDKATLTFDAISGLTLTGTVAEIDSVGTVSQGVVSYNIKIAFDKEDPRIKPGMTVDAAIQTGVAANVVEVPSSAVKTIGSQNIVEVFDPPISQSEVAAAGSAGVVTDETPKMVPVTTDLSDDTNVEITQGLSAGEQIIASTKSGSASNASGASPANGIPNGKPTFGGGGAVRVGGGLGGNATFVRGG
ncbi:MAG: HlyD family efflux transporter periplasmic adaptor subunit [Minisyncoccia bacterium]